MTNEPPPMPALTIDYADVRVTNRTMSLKAARWVFGLTIVPTLVGVSILLGFGLTGWEELPGFGFMWLGVGGAMTFVLGIIALVNCVRAFGRVPKEALVGQWYVYAILAALAAVGAAYFCARVGTAWMEAPHLPVSITNGTSTPIDEVIVHFDGRDVKAQNLGPGQSKQFGVLWVTHAGGPLEITTKVAGQTRRKADRLEFRVRGHEHSPPQRCDVIVEDAELPKKGKP